MESATVPEPIDTQQAIEVLLAKYQRDFIPKLTRLGHSKRAAVQYLIRLGIEKYEARRDLPTDTGSVT